MDVKVAFLNGNLTRKYTGHNLNCLHPKIAIMYACFGKSIYGLKQAYWSWNIYFNDVIMESDFIQNKDEPSV